MRKTTLTILFLVAGILCGLSAQTFSTHTFAIVDGDTLRMDVYSPANAEGPTPAVLFAFGGGFTHGYRNDPRYIPYFKFLTDNGITAISTDYRTQLAKVEPSTLASPSGFATALGSAITDAVSDYYRASGYVIANAAQLNIDPTKIIASGSSAGAITALQAEYQLVNKAVPEGLFPAWFNYAGIVTFAGAICAQGQFGWIDMPCPMMLFHGDADSTVPYGSISVGPVSLNGSKTIATTLTAAGVPHTFYTVASKDHSVALAPMEDNLWNILAIIRQTVLGGQKVMVNTVETPIGAPTDYKTDFTLADYIRSNMP